MDIQIYAKLHEQISNFNDVLDIIRSDGDNVYVTIENQRAFRKLEQMMSEYKESVFVISSLTSLGTNDADIATRLSWFIQHNIRLAICEFPSTYEYGVEQLLNQAVLSTVLQSVLNGNKKIVEVSFKKSSVGRSKLPFPDNWDSLYAEWKAGKITSKEFRERAGLKKASFYNLLTEYREIQKENEEYIRRYKLSV